MAYRAPTRNKQRGASLIGAIFLITGLAILGGLLSRLLVVGTEETLQEWYASQALYAAESGINWSIYNGGASATDQTVIDGRSWFDVSATTTNIAGKDLIVITSTGKTGDSLGNIKASRRIVVRYMR